MFRRVKNLFFFKRNKHIKKAEIEEAESYKNGLMCRFVLDGFGKKLGESVAIDEDIVIIKSGAKYIGVPLKHVEEEGKTLLVKGLIDDFNAEKMGEKWRQENLKEIEYNKEKDGF